MHQASQQGETGRFITKIYYIEQGSIYEYNSLMPKSVQLRRKTRNKDPHTQSVDGPLKIYVSSNYRIF